LVALVMKVLEVRVTVLTGAAGNEKYLIGIGLPITEEPSQTTRHTDHVPRRFG